MMKRILPLVPVLLLALSGCAATGEGSSAREQRAVAPEPAATGEAVTVVGLGDVADEPVDCVAGELRAALGATRVIPPKEFRQSMYPWFEPRVAPTDTESLKNLMLQRKVEERITKMHLHYIVTIRGVTSVSRDSGSVFYFWIVWGQTEKTALSAAILDIKQMRHVGQFEAEATGGTSAGVVLLVPYGYSVSSVKKACQAIAERVVAYVTGKAQAEPANAQPKD
jgi:hypothetical protein